MRHAAAAVLILALAAAAGAARLSPPDPFAFLGHGAPTTAADRARLDAGTALVRLLPASGRELGAVAAVRIDAPPERLVAWMRHIEALRRSRYVPVVARLSAPPRLEDLEALTLDAGDLDEVRRCRPGDCAIKLSAGEMARLQARATGRPGWPSAVQQEFRRLVLDRVEAYLQDGDAGLPPYHDKRTAVSPAAAFASLADALGLMRPSGVSAYVRDFPHAVHPDVVDSFLYWSRETFGAKPIVNVTHVTLVLSDGAAAPRALAISKQVFATHYRDAAVSLTAVTGQGADRYLVYVHRSQVDVLQGLFGGLARRAIEGRIRDEAASLLDGVRRRLEGGDPP